MRGFSVQSSGKKRYPYPDLSIETISNWGVTPYKDPVDKDLLLDGLRKAGLPETLSIYDALRKAEEK